MVLLIALLLALGAFALFGATAAQHEQRVLRRRLDKRERQRARGAAWLLILATLATSLWRAGSIAGLIPWIGLTMLAAALVFLALNLGEIRSR